MKTHEIQGTVIALANVTAVTPVQEAIAPDSSWRAWRFFVLFVGGGELLFCSEELKADDSNSLSEKVKLNLDRSELVGALKAI